MGQKRLEWFASSSSQCNFDSLSLFSLKDTKSGAVVGVVFPAGGVFGWAAIGGWSGTEATKDACKTAVEDLEIIRGLAKATP